MYVQCSDLNLVRRRNHKKKSVFFRQKLNRVRKIIFNQLTQVINLGNGSAMYYLHLAYLKCETLIVYSLIDRIN